MPRPTCESLALARERGEKFYFSGKPCPRGHIADRRVHNWNCIECEKLNWKKPRPNRIRNRNKEKEKADHKLWLKNNPDKVKKHKQKHYAADKEKGKRRAKNWMISNPMKRRAIAARYDARKKNAEGSFTAEDIAAMFESQGGKCRYCEASLETRYHIDHRVPLARGGTNWPSNLQLLCQPCNNKKYALDPDEFERSIGFAA